MYDDNYFGDEQTRLLCDAVESASASCHAMERRALRLRDALGRARRADWAEVNEILDAAIASDDAWIAAAATHR